MITDSEESRRAVDQLNADTQPQPKFNIDDIVMVVPGKMASNRCPRKAKILYRWFGTDGYYMYGVEVIANGNRGTFDELHVKPLSEFCPK